MPDPHALLELVHGRLTTEGVPHALIGAAALAAHGISRSTVDVDLLVTERRVLAPSFWIGLPANIDVDIRLGDDADPLAGVVRFRSASERDVDVVVGRGQWQADIVARAEAPPRASQSLRAIRADDLILLKLFAGGSQDRWDVEQLLALPDAAALRVSVDSRVGQLPVVAQTLWRQLRDVSGA